GHRMRANGQISGRYLRRCDTLATGSSANDAVEALQASREPSSLLSLTFARSEMPASRTSPAKNRRCGLFANFKASQAGHAVSPAFARTKKAASNETERSVFMIAPCWAGDATSVVVRLQGN